MSAETKPRILTGMRPSGDLHLGHHAGALKEWLKYEQKGWECFFLVADYHALGDNVGNIAKISKSVLSVAADWMAVGLDPESSGFVIQSKVNEHAELSVLLSSLVSKGELDRNPTLRAEMTDLGKDSVTLGFYIYPALQVADILLPKATLVPVGNDQIPHLRLAQRVARRFNENYGDVFPKPLAHLSETPRLVGTDGSAKMSKSKNNCIYLADDPKTVAAKVKKMFTDPTRLRPTDPGDIVNNPVFIYHRAFNPNLEEVRDLEQRYTQGRVGDVEVKEKLIIVINEMLAPIREKRAEIDRNPESVIEALRSGSARERSIAEETLAEVRKAMGIVYF